MNKKPIEALKNIGLSEKEITIYLACLELGASTTIQISQKTDFKRTTAYSIIESLLKKSFLSKFEDKRGQKFSAEPPEKLVNSLQQKEKQLLEAIPNLLAISKAESNIRPEVKFYQGKEGLKAVYEDTLAYCQKGDEILTCVSVNDFYNVLSDYAQSYLQRRITKGINMRAITHDTEKAKEHRANDKAELRQTKLLSKNTIQVSIEKNIYKDKVALMNFRGFQFGIIIKSPQIAKSEKAMFDLLWNKLPQ
ncbi:MAG: helix-turn-helix domain-containing protein [Candidatus Pacebacteria bacterium]|nr:helix-turn-helix domain-containing protein [Candidatus Paceibacterota bacterium]